MNKTTELFCLIYDFCQQFEPLLEQRMLDESSDKQRRRRTCEMSLSEMTTIVLLFHTMRGRQFKAFYRGIVCRFMTSEFPRQQSYTRFVALTPRCAAGGLVRDTQGRLHGPVDCRRHTAGCSRQLGASNATEFSWVLPSEANPPPAGSTASSCTRSSTIVANCWPSRSLRATSIEPQGTAGHHIRPVWHPVRR